MKAKKSKKLSQVKYCVVLGSTIFTFAMRSRRKDAIADFIRGDSASWDEEKERGCRVVRFRLTEEE